MSTLLSSVAGNGSAAAWQLSQRGREVVLLERFTPGHKEGASHGASRNLNLSYSEPNYLSLLQRAVPLWSELEQETGTSVFDEVGVVTHGAHPSLTGVRDALDAHGFAAEILSAEAASERWGGMRFETDVLWTPQAGRLNADVSVPRCRRLLLSAGPTFVTASGSKASASRRMTGWW
ncbi:glycine/D-amino acid oxidase-like deaminating enzyme [Lysinibacter cavernae]|uniref:Glycine/D-amino acid oxidase-like deaminating enzyme n=1 Tax=Lysinibacter cavernae TaxID=1640652 RepID=A0A7X5TTD1_9MICO|nr:FAD-dependent oxidoreductase [Lysinibacter cavernae]NIH54055.1 glycine/D-amino acid oxidase-like deaminating enzyme [Lysinibacter cavernae]